MNDVTIIGGGLAGLVCGIRLARAGFKTAIIEKREYPFHKVCGEYVSNEVVPFLEREDLLNGIHALPSISRFQLTSENGNHATVDLRMGGFGISRFKLDHALSQKALDSGVDIVHDEIREFYHEPKSDVFVSQLSGQRSVRSKFLIGAYGKRSRLDKDLDREFIQKRSPWVGVKYHLDFDVPEDLISLHNFPRGYCGISKVENGITNLCYLTHRQNIPDAGGVPEMEEKILSKNPFLKEIFGKATILFEKPMVINEVSFYPKSTHKNGMIMIGDTAGLIAPLCGNGMAMAIHSGKMLSDILIKGGRDADRHGIIREYSMQWKRSFKTRLWMGRTLQKMFGKIKSSNRLVDLMRFQPSVAKYLIDKTHGRTI